MNIEDLGKFLETYTFDYLMESALSQVPEDIDIREGSIIYDSLAPACYQLADFYMQLKNLLLDTFPQTAIGEYLDLKVAEHGLTRYPASKAIKIGYFEDESGQPMSVPINARFSTIETNSVLYIVKQSNGEPGSYQLECETEGTVGNRYVGALLPIDNINNLSKATLTTLHTPGRDIESDDELRQRFFTFINEKAFGGNFIEYVTEIREIDGVGSVQVYPVWNGGGTVKAVILDSEYNPASSSFISQVKELVDPEPHEGKGMGFAPIGHKVTITTAEQLNIDIAFKIDLMTGYTVEQLRPQIIGVIQDHFLFLRKSWGNFSETNTYNMTVYRSQLMSAILRITGIANIAEMKLNGMEADIELQMDAEKSQLPFLNGVTIT
ncbi:baseplate J/gp47 family protein [Bacillaceae bacterium Marseille-Q3522]|nr:baseplate J/gp47 family protein [Bacillaceae bacterium Marseille-Q3522]